MFKNGRLELEGLRPQELLNIVRGTAEHFDINIKVPQAHILQTLQNMDHIGCPLYAYFYALALTEGNGRGIELNSRDELLEITLKRHHEVRYGVQ